MTARERKAHDEMTIQIGTLHMMYNKVQTYSRNILEIGIVARILNRALVGINWD